MTPRDRQRLTRLATRARTATTQRDQLVRAVYAAGDTSLAEIAKAIGMTKPGVSRIIARGDTERELAQALDAIGPPK